MSRTTQDDEYDPEAEPMENIGRALFLIARNLGAMGVHLKNLGTGDAASPMGAVEMLAVKLKEGADAIAEAIYDASGEASPSVIQIGEVAEELKSVARAIRDEPEPE